MQWADLQRIIAEEVAAALARGRDPHVRVPLGARTTAVPTVCEASSTRVRRGWASTPARECRRTWRRSSITRSSRPMRRAHEIEKLCHEAREFGFATVCVNPTWVATVRHACSAGSSTGRLHGRRIPVGRDNNGREADMRRAVSFTMVRSEVDMVINVGALKSGDLGVVERDIAAVASACRDCGVLSKVIIEAALLSDEEKISACARRPRPRVPTT